MPTLPTKSILAALAGESPVGKSLKFAVSKADHHGAPVRDPDILLSSSPFGAESLTVGAASAFNRSRQLPLPPRKRGSL